MLAKKLLQESKLRPWLATWILIYLGFVILDAFFPGFFGITILKMLGIVLCVVYAWQKFKNDPLLIIALSFTLLADTFLAINSTSFSGVFTFCFAQFFHTSRLSKTRPSFLIVYFTFIVLAVLAACLLKIDPLYVLGVIYAYGLLTNLYLSARWYFKEHSERSACAFFGFLLFLCCDTCVGLSYLSATAILPTAIHRFVDYFAWAFYYPSQVLISNSSTRNRSEKLASKSLGKNLAPKKPSRSQKVAKNS